MGPALVRGASPGARRDQGAGEGTLLFDGFGNLEMEIRTDETTGQALSEAGIPSRRDGSR